MNDNNYTIHGDTWEWIALKDSVEWARTETWTLGKFEKMPALIYRVRGEITSIKQYVGQKYNPDSSEFNPEGWTHEHCEICGWDIAPSDNPEVGIAFHLHDKYSWICQECHGLFIDKPKDHDS